MHTRTTTRLVELPDQRRRVLLKADCTHDPYRALGRSEKARREAYRALFRTQLDPEVVRDIRAVTTGNYALGSMRFQKEMGTMLGQWGDTG